MITETAVLPTPAQQRWMALEYGMFIHFGPNTLVRTGWGDGKFPAESFDIPHLDTAQWAGVAAEAGMRYAVLTAKHHDGFCLWPTRHTPYSVASAPRKPDIVGSFVEECRKAGIAPGLYYSLWDRNYPDYENDEIYAQFMRDQIEELLTDYGDIVEVWFDGGWDKEHPTREWPFDPAWLADPHSGYSPGLRWEWKALYELMHRLQPDTLVLNNSSSDRPGGIRYLPVDARTSEHFNFIYHERLVPPNLETIWTGEDGQPVFLPLEFNTTLTQGWFLSSDHDVHPPVGAIRDWRETARQANANLLLNVGPNAAGVIPSYNADFLRKAR